MAAPKFTGTLTPRDNSTQEVRKGLFDMLKKVQAVTSYAEEVDKRVGQYPDGVLIPGTNLVIKTKVLYGTTASTQGGHVDIAHGLDPAKIINIGLKIEYSGYGSYFPGMSSYSGFIADAYINNTLLTHIRIENRAGNSGNILSKPFTVLIWYEV